eukprot:TRINITY_DN3549_c0_g1_i2.p1 TRINITY_DN3549_c0_g1~~TRINITY_DN3549_c0_g1_i2.p1  ORF type:complete len:1287 (+),score=344.35 TRINITY_DN3549_c0_g1_i2:53-3913(+)
MAPKKKGKQNSRGAKGGQSKSATTQAAQSSTADGHAVDEAENEEEHDEDAAKEGMEGQEENRKRSSSEADEASLPAKRLKAGQASSPSAININEVVTKEYEASSLAEIAEAPVSALQGIGPKMAQALKALKIKTIRDLADWKYYRAASAIACLAPLEQEGARSEEAAMNINQVLDKACEMKSLKEILELKPSALQGLAAAADKALSTLHVKTVGQLGEWKYARWAEFIVNLAKFEEASATDGKEDDKPLVPTAASPKPLAPTSGAHDDAQMVGAHDDAQAEGAHDDAEAEGSAADGEEDDKPLVPTAASLKPVAPTSGAHDNAQMVGAHDDAQAEGAHDDAGAEGDVWQQLDDTLQAPLEGVTARQLPVVAADDEDDDDWGLVWKGPESSSKEKADVLQEIQRNASVSAGWHKEEWKKAKLSDEEDEENWGEENPAWGANMYQTAEEEKRSKDDWVPDTEWSGMEDMRNSKEALAVENIVRKIRSRALAAALADRVDEKKQAEMFPSDQLLEDMKMKILRKPEDARLLLVLLLWLEAKTLELSEEPPDLNKLAHKILGAEDTALRAVCSHVPPHVLLQKADVRIPSPQLRKGEAESTLKDLMEKLRDSLSFEFQVADVEEDVWPGIPMTVRIMAVIHVLQHVNLMKLKYTSINDVIGALGRACLMEQAMEVVCRVSLYQAIGLARDMLVDEKADPYRMNKEASLNRLAVEWRTSPNAAQLAQLHMLSRERQLHVLLSIERDVELFWHKLVQKVASREEQSNQLRNFLEFERLLRPYMREEDLGAMKRSLAEESGQKISTLDLAQMRQGVSDVLKGLKSKYMWKPSKRTRREVCRVNWVARLSAVLNLAMRTDCLWADETLRKLLQEDNFRKLGLEVFDKYKKWARLEEGDGMAIKKPKIASTAILEQVRQLYSDYKSDSQRYPGQQGFAPSTPAGLGAGGMTPGLPATMTPGLYGAPSTPGVRAPTPVWQPGPGTPAPSSRGATPQWRPPGTPMGPASGTPAGPPPATPAGRPAGFQARPPGSPGGPPPATPAGPSGFRAASGTPAGPPPATPASPSGFRAAGTPAGPPPATPASPSGFRAAGTPAGPPPATPASPSGFRAAGTPAGPPPATPASPGSLAAARTPAGPPPATPLPGSQGGGLPPMTPGGLPPMTPGSPAGLLGPKTPATGGPSTPKVESKAEGDVTPSVPFTPAGGAQTPKVEGKVEGGVSPMTPGMAGRSVPFTPAGPAPATAVANAGVPQTPGASVPFTPAGPAPATAVGGAPRTPGIAPFTPAGPAPATAKPQ